MGKVAAIFLVLSGLVGGIGVWWLQTRAFYDEPVTIAEVVLTRGGAPVAVPAEGISIDADSSPLRYRGCFSVAPPPPEADPYPRPEPTVAPGWFECFDAAGLGADLAAGAATAVLARADIRYGIDRVAALYPDGRGYLWHQINRCGAAVFGGDPLPEGCAPPPEGPPS